MTFLGCCGLFFFGGYFITDVIDENKHYPTSFVPSEQKQTPIEALLSRNSRCEISGNESCGGVREVGNAVVSVTTVNLHAAEPSSEEALKMALCHQWYQSGFQWNEIAQLGDDKRLSCAQ